MLNSSNFIRRKEDAQILEFSDICYQRFVPGERRKLIKPLTLIKKESQELILEDAVSLWFNENLFYHQLNPISIFTAWYIQKLTLDNKFEK